MSTYQITFQGYAPKRNNKGETDLEMTTQVEIFVGNETQLIERANEIERYLGNKVIGMDCLDEVTVCILPQTTEQCLILQGFEGDEYICDMSTALILMDELEQWDWTIIEGHPSKTFQVRKHAFDNWVELYNVQRNEA